MRITDRDIKLVKDIALSHLLSRDQIIELGYFGSVTRANSRLRELSAISLVRRLDTPFFNQSLYMAGRLASQVTGERISRIIEKRTSSPRFVQHAISVTNVRIALAKKGATDWRFEQQLWQSFNTGKRFEIRPDGMVVTNSLPLFVEVDCGHISATKFKEKLLAYQAFAQSGKCLAIFKTDSFRVLTITTGESRSRRLRQLVPANAGFEFLSSTFQELGVKAISSWS